MQAGVSFGNGSPGPVNFGLDGGRTLQLGGTSTAMSASNGGIATIDLNATNPNSGLSDAGSGTLTILSGATFNDETTTTTGLNILASPRSSDTGSTAAVNNEGTFTKAGRRRLRRSPRCSTTPARWTSRAEHLCLQARSSSSGGTISVTGGGAVEVGTNAASVAGAVHVAGAASVQGFGTINAAVVNDASIMATGGTLHILGAVSGTGSFSINNSAALDLGASVAATETLTFSGSQGTLQFDNNAASFGATVSGVTSSGNVIDFSKINPIQASVSYNPTTDVLVVSDATHTATINVVGGIPTGDTFAPTADGSGGTKVFIAPNQPVISGPLTGTVQVDGSMVAQGHLTASNSIVGDTQTWSIVGGTPDHSANYQVAVDDLKVEKILPGDTTYTTLFDDQFNGAAPPGGPTLLQGNGSSNPFSVTAGDWVTGTDASGRSVAILDTTHARSAGVPFFGEVANVLTDNDPATPANGLRIGQSFRESAVFDLSAAANIDIGVSYGIRLAARQLTFNGGATDQPGTEVVDLRIVRVDPATNNGSSFLIQLQERNYAAGTNTNVPATILQSINLNPAAADDQILLQLTHNGPTSGADTGLVNASFSLLKPDPSNPGSEIVDGSPVNFTNTGKIFDNEDWVRPSIVLSANGIQTPAPNADSIMFGQYGALDLAQDGTWTYGLSNGQAQGIPDGTLAHDTFNVQVTDGHGGTDTKVIDVTVAKPSHLWGDTKFPAVVAGQHVFSLNPQANFLGGFLALDLVTTTNFNPNSQAAFQQTRTATMLDSFFLPDQSPAPVIFDTSTVTPPSRSFLIAPNVNVAGVLTPEAIEVHITQANPDGTGSNIINRDLITGGNGGLQVNALAPVGDQSTTSKTIYNLTESYRTSDGTASGTLTSYDVAWDQYDSSAPTPTYHVYFQTFNPDNSALAASPVLTAIAMNNGTLPAWFFRSAFGEYGIAYTEFEQCPECEPRPDRADLRPRSRHRLHGEWCAGSRNAQLVHQSRPFGAPRRRQPHYAADHSIDQPIPRADRAAA